MRAFCCYLTRSWLNSHLSRRIPHCRLLPRRLRQVRFLRIRESGVDPRGLVNTVDDIFPHEMPGFDIYITKANRNCFLKGWLLRTYEQNDFLAARLIAERAKWIALSSFSSLWRHSFIHFDADQGPSLFWCFDRIGALCFALAFEGKLLELNKRAEWASVSSTEGALSVCWRKLLWDQPWATVDFGMAGISASSGPLLGKRSFVCILVCNTWSDTQNLVYSHLFLQRFLLFSWKVHGV